MITKLKKNKEYKYSKFNSSRSEYNIIYGYFDIFQAHNVITELINKISTLA